MQALGPGQLVVPKDHSGQRALTVVKADEIATAICAEWDNVFWKAMLRPGGKDGPEAVLCPGQERKPATKGSRHSSTRDSELAITARAIVPQRYLAERWREADTQ